MHLKDLIFTLSFLTTSAFPLHGNTRETTWVNSKVNQAHEKTDITKDIDKMYKSKIVSDGLYVQGNDNNKNPLADELQRKLIIESERLRIRLRQELAELQERLSPSADHPTHTLAAMKERLSPLTQQLQSSLRSNSQDLCSQLSIYLQALETAEAQADGPALYQEALQWMGRTLEHSSLKLTGIINDFHSNANGVIENLKQSSGSDQDSKVFEESSSRLRQEVGSLREDTQSRTAVLKAQLAALLQSAQNPKAQMTGSVERFCQSASQQSEALQDRMERVFTGQEEKLHDVHQTSSLLPSSSSSTQESSSLQEDFSVRLSALIQDILHSVQ